MDVVTYALANSQAKKQIDDALEPFIVTCTPTELDYSGTTDKTGAEIMAAYEAGKNIIFRLWETSTLFYDLQVTLASKLVSDAVAKFQAFGLVSGLLIVIQTPAANTNIYETEIFTLTPAS